MDLDAVTALLNVAQAIVAQHPKDHAVEVEVRIGSMRANRFDPRIPADAMHRSILAAPAGSPSCHWTEVRDFFHSGNLRTRVVYDTRRGQITSTTCRKQRIQTVDIAGNPYDLRVCLSREHPVDRPADLVLPTHVAIHHRTQRALPPHLRADYSQTWRGSGTGPECAAEREQQTTEPECSVELEVVDMAKSLAAHGNDARALATHLLAVSRSFLSPPSDVP